MTELEQLIDELVAKGGPTTGQIKLNQDPVKVARLLELGWKEPEPTKESVQETIDAAGISKVVIKQRLEALEATIADHEKRIHQLGIRR